MMAWCRWSYPLFTPTSLWFIYSSKSCFILKHYLCSCLFINKQAVQVLGFNFFEESCSSLLADFGCFERGITLRQLCLFKILYIFPIVIVFPLCASNSSLISCGVIIMPCSDFSVKDVKIFSSSLNDGIVTRHRGLKKTFPS